MLGLLLLALDPLVVGAIILFAVGSAIGVVAELRREAQRREDRAIRLSYARARYRRRDEVL